MSRYNCAYGGGRRLNCIEWFQHWGVGGGGGKMSRYNCAYGGGRRLNFIEGWGGGGKISRYNCAYGGGRRLNCIEWLQHWGVGGGGGAGKMSRYNCAYGGGRRLNCIEWFLVLSEGQHSAEEFSCNAWLSDLSDANWVESYPRDETAMIQIYLLCTLLHWVIFSPFRGTT